MGNEFEFPFSDLKRKNGLNHVKYLWNFFFQIEWVFGGIAKFNYCVYSIRQVLNKPRVYNLIIFYPAFSLRGPGPECLCIFIPQGYLFMLQSFTTLRWKFSINIWVSMQMFDNRSVTHGGFAINAQ